MPPITEKTLGLFHTEGNREAKKIKEQEKKSRNKSQTSNKKSLLFDVNGPLDSLYFSNQHFTTHLCFPYSVIIWRTKDSFMISTTVSEEFGG